MPQNRAAYVLLTLLMLPVWLMATHNRAGEITYRHISGYTYEVTILTYTFTPSLANRDSLEVNWGDGSPLQYLQIDKKVFLANNVRYNTYVGTHTYPGAGTYTISMVDPNRNAGIVNIPGSVNQAFYLASTLVINPFLGPNSSPQLLAPPIDNACVFYPFMHNVTAYDPDGDSLSYKLIPCKGAQGLDIPTYVLPAASVSLSIDPITGDFLWDSPLMSGEFNIAILIEEWRNGVRIGTVIRDMQIFVAACNNQPPVIAPINDTCVIVGDTLVMTITATDPNSNQVTLSAAGGPMVLTSSPATFTSQPGTPPVTGTFTWIAGCNAVRRLPHQMTFKATDNGVPVNLFDLESVFILVIAPPVDTVEAYPLGSTMVIDWSVSPCPQASGYSVYRRAGSSPFQPGPCITGIPDWAGYEKIATLQGINNTFYIDDNKGAGLLHGLNYCYRIVVNFPDGAQSLASHEVCRELLRDVPVITNVTVIETHGSAGALNIRWMPPLELDSTIAPGPYLYLIQRAVKGTQNYLLVDSLVALADTSYIDAPINTRDLGYTYRIDLINNQPGNRFLIGSSHPASSVFLEAIPQDRQLDLSWKAQTPWVNTLYTIYRQNPVTTDFDSIAVTTGLTYTDTELNNGTTYCYLVRSTGSYFTPDIPDPLINWSQIVCAVPYDNVGPCPPPLSITTNCISNTIKWPMPDPDCGGDIAGYELWFTPGNSKDFKLIYSTSNPFDTLFIHQLMPASVIGCYKILGIDSTGNTGPFSQIVCIDDESCDQYKIPNVFTPNGDQINDQLFPFPYTNVDRIDLKIMSRWGNEVFNTTDPEIRWDGTHWKTGEPVSAGVYYYVCDVWFMALEGTRKRTLTGVVHVLK